jgi:isopentenyl diphosphate isomerase/L-lactate dehydrogenase-like FMN-dependent dehydrogenase
MDGRLRQQQIYLEGVFGRRPRVSTDLTRLEADAEQVMRPDAFAYVAGGAGTGATMRANREAFGRHRIVPRMLRDASRRDTSVELFGRRLAAPFLLAPIGVAEMAHPDADLATARAAASEGVPMVFSNQASVPMERVAAELGESPHWFQLYWSTSNDLVESFVARAEACGCEAIVVTLDTTLLGWRTRDLDIGFLPFLRGMGIAQYTSDPVFRRLVEEEASAPRTPVETPRPTASALSTLLSLRRRRVSRESVQRFTQIYSRPSLSWDDLPFLRERTRLPILLKGICHPDDARRALDSGVDGVIVSNHGGRQVDGAIATLDALPGVVEAVGGAVPVLLDSGVRSGADVFKALALGARAVLLGRPYIYALALAGEAGVRQVLRDLHADFDLTLGLAGYSAAADVGPEALAV